MDAQQRSLDCDLGDSWWQLGSGTGSLCRQGNREMQTDKTRQEKAVRSVKLYKGSQNVHSKWMLHSMTPFLPLYTDFFGSLAVFISSVGSFSPSPQLYWVILHFFFFFLLPLLSGILQQNGMPNFLAISSFTEVQHFLNTLLVEDWRNARPKA